MTNLESGQQGESRLVYVLPRIRLAGDAFAQEQFSIGKASFLPDEPNSWADKIQLPRPSWLDIYRQFPYMDSDDAPEPASGTLIVSEDNDWLKKHIGRLVGVAYVIGVAQAQWRVPADAFQYSAFTASASPQVAVILHTKTGSKIEDLSSLQLLPPLELRGVSDLFRLNLKDEKHAELIRRFDRNPYDRLAVACYHLFRSQFDNPVAAPAEQDFAAYCACLEAALDVTGPDYSKELCDKLVVIYGKYPAMERWIKGLYSERSVFNHGASSEPSLDSPDDRMRALAEFRRYPLNWDALRKLCRDVIMEQLQNSLDAARRELSRMWDPTRALLRTLFYSDAVWAGIFKDFTQAQSVQKILALQGDDQVEFVCKCNSFLSQHSWRAMREVPEQKKVFVALKAMAALVGECAKKNDDKEGQSSATQLFNAADGKDGGAVYNWAKQYTAWDKEFSASNFEEAVRAVAQRTAMFFRNAR